MDDNRISEIQQAASDLSMLAGVLTQCVNGMTRLNEQMVRVGRSPLFTAAKIKAMEDELARVQVIIGKLRAAMPDIRGLAL
jgi:hypothetical protein